MKFIEGRKVLRRRLAETTEVFNGSKRSVGLSKLVLKLDKKITTAGKSSNLKPSPSELGHLIGEEVEKITELLKHLVSMTEGPHNAEIGEFDRIEKMAKQYKSSLSKITKQAAAVLEESKKADDK